jgi:hypothetical protein
MWRVATPRLPPQYAEHTVEVINAELSLSKAEVEELVANDTLDAAAW